MLFPSSIWSFLASKRMTSPWGILFEDEGGTDIFNKVMGIVSSPTRTNSVELKKETYNRG